MAKSFLRNRERSNQAAGVPPSSGRGQSYALRLHLKIAAKANDLFYWIEQ
jgi:hypothetical protein